MSIWQDGNLVKTTVEISDALLEKAKRVARDRGITLRAVLEEALTQFLSSGPPDRRFKLEDCSVQGDGPSREFADAEWSRWRAAAYGDRE